MIKILSRLLMGHLVVVVVVIALCLPGTARKVFIAAYVGQMLNHRRSVFTFARAYRWVVEP